jgi:hypothetical protein
MCNKYLENDLLFIPPFNNDLWPTVIRKFPRQHNAIQVAKDYYNYDGMYTERACRELFCKLEMLPLPSSVYERNRNQLSINSEIYQANLHLPSVNVTKYQKIVYYLDIKVFCALLSLTKTEFDNLMRFSWDIIFSCSFPILHCFYSINNFPLHIGSIAYW